MASKSSSRVLTDHDEIRNWAEDRGAKPATVRNTHTDDNVGIIRLDFPGYSGAGSLEEIEWDEWFDNFDDNNLALIVQDETSGGEQSNFNKLVNRDKIQSESSTRTKGKKSASGRSYSAKKSSARSKSRGSQSGNRSSDVRGRSTEGRNSGKTKTGSRRKAA